MQTNERDMSAKGTVLFSASEGYDEDMWDDSALIREYDRALQSSRLDTWALSFISVVSTGMFSKKGVDEMSQREKFPEEKT